MKKILIIPAVLLLFTALNAQPDIAAVKKNEKTLDQQEATIKKEKKEEHKELKKLEGNEVSYKTKQQFAIDFPQVNVTNWSRSTTKIYDIATYQQNGVTLQAYYDADSKLVGTITNKTFTDLPIKAQNYINKKYAGYNKSNVILYDDNEFNSTDMMMYDIQFDDVDNYFVELTKDDKTLVLMVHMNGDVSFFKEIK